MVDGTSEHSDLLPCPFCGGGEPELVSDGISAPCDVWVQCVDCQAQGPATRVGCRDEEEDEEDIDLEAEAIELWNTRTAPAPLGAEVTAPKLRLVHGSAATVHPMILDQSGAPMRDLKPSEQCDHGVVFDEQAYLAGMHEHEVRKRWPRLDGHCPKGCGFHGIAYASGLHYTAGDW